MTISVGDCLESIDLYNHRRPRLANDKEQVVRFRDMLGRKIIIDKEKCDGCGLCVNACHEGAIGLVDGKAELVNANLCDGIGDCLPACPQGAITMTLGTIENKACPMAEPGYQWPIQIGLVPAVSSFFDGTLVVAADCTAFSIDDFKGKFLSGKPVVIGCPKLDEEDYAEKLTQIIANNNIKSVTVARMEVPCCGGMENAVIRALQSSGKFIPWRIVIISTDGRILD